MAMTPDGAELLARMRAKHGDPYMPLSMAQKLEFHESKHAHSRTEFDRRERERVEDERRRLTELVSGRDGRRNP